MTEVEPIHDTIYRIDSDGTPLNKKHFANSLSPRLWMDIDFNFDGTLCLFIIFVVRNTKPVISPFSIP